MDEPTSELIGRGQDERGFIGGFVYAVCGDDGDDPAHHWVVYGILLGGLVGGGIGATFGLLKEIAFIGGIAGFLCGAVAAAIRVAHSPRPGSPVCESPSIEHKADR